MVNKRWVKLIAWTPNMWARRDNQRVPILSGGTGEACDASGGDVRAMDGVLYVESG